MNVVIPDEKTHHLLSRNKWVYVIPAQEYPAVFPAAVQAFKAVKVNAQVKDQVVIAFLLTYASMKALGG